MKFVEIYGKENCRFCVDAKRHCESLKINYIYRDIGNSLNRDEMLQRNPAATHVPQIFIGEVLIGGFDQLSVMPLYQLHQMIGE